MARIRSAARKPYKKRTIPAASRRALAKAHGCEPLKVADVACCYCGAPGRIHWITPSWVWFENLEMDHVHPEFHGGDSSPTNLVLACRRCNRSKGARHA